MTNTAEHVVVARAAQVASNTPRAASAPMAVASLCLAMLLSSLGTSIANVSLPSLVQAFIASFQQVQWVVIAYLLAVTTLVVSVGRLGDLLGRRRLLLAGILVFTAASAACGLAPSLKLLLVARAVQGLGAAIMMALTVAFVGATVSRDKTGSAMGLLGTMSAVGTALGPTLGGALIAGFAWPAIFFVNIPLGVVAVLLAYRYLPADRPRAKAGRISLDATGTLLLTLTLAAYALAMTQGRAGSGSVNIELLLIAITGAMLFVLVERYAASPLVRLRMFRDPILSAGFGMSMLVSTVVMATLVVGPFYLSGALALDAARVGLIMSCGPLVAALTGVPAGRLVDRLGAQRMTVAGLVGMATGSVGLAMLPTDSGIPGYVVPLVVMTAGYAVFQAANNTAVMSTADAEQRGVISGLLALSRNLGLITGASAMGAVYAFGSSLADLGAVAGAASGMRMTFAVASVLVIAALVLAVVSGRASR